MALVQPFFCLTKVKIISMKKENIFKVAESVALLIIELARLALEYFSK